MKNDASTHLNHSHGKADYVGIVGSVLCLIHCLITPALAIGGSLSVHDHPAGGLLNYFFILFNGIAVYFATRDHKIPVLRLFLWSAFVLFSCSLLLETHNPAFHLMGYLGSALLILGHVYNLVYCKPWGRGERRLKVNG
ncbi:MerC domain-containing protein [Persicitalea jodogahamensis]|uniref:MerC domain-containing protein n=1 Tax=Persicitalea jodogahamensis TaxID=402147 RepID=A0A8J3D7T1_9BACT|nr:MerC domain-containing protein [Persicitalea jodogahamensis]GHB58422.1 hypothetical protein GCM10007390_09890 [Persicitalea jodogahamensis]